MSTGVSVVICCYNSSKRLPETLRHLAAQQVPGELPWEVVIIDNASTDDTAETARRCWPSGNPALLRIVSEPQAGLSHARIRGISEARHEIISFIDDDNWAAEDWIKRVSGIFTSHPEVGACGGRIEGVLEITPPDWFELVKLNCAVGSQHDQNGDITDTSGTLLWGAGLNLRTAAAKKLLEDGFDFRMSGRMGNALSTGEDTELCFALRASGWRFWYDDDLVLRHFIPKERMRWDYAIRLMRGMGESSVLFELYLIALNTPFFAARPPWKKSWAFYMLTTLRQFAAVTLLHPIDCVRLPEGSAHALAFELTKGRLASLWALCGRYDKTRDSIRQEDWARPRQFEAEINQGVSSG